MSLTPCSQGWAATNEDGLTVFADELLIIDSPYDWEVRNRLLSDPVRKP